jgi:hypothetical protein
MQEVASLAVTGREALTCEGKKVVLHVDFSSSRISVNFYSNVC